MPRATTPELNRAEIHAAVARMWRAGESPAAIARQLNIDVKRVYRVRFRLKLQPRRTLDVRMPGKAAEIAVRDEKIMRMRSRDMSCDAIARACRVTLPTVYQTLKRLGLSVSRRKSVLQQQEGVPL